MCDGSLTAMLPAVTVGQFGIERGPQVYSYMYSVFGVSSMIGLTLIDMGAKDTVGFNGMQVISFCFSSVAGIMAICLKEKKPFDYVEVY